MSAEQLSQQQSLYRRHRPRTFAEVVGQEPVVRTLRNAVERGKVHHAYLFVGSRGTGKTSMAKILAACLNCENGPTIEPCGKCDSCLSIARATSLDVIEMDAASNNSVDDIRELRESVAYAPVSGRRKIYILDEAHMLSTAAWNAFLKTLEEPPPNTVFVLATTEANKVPATVVDRCHRFDFHRPTVEQIAEVLRRSAQSESIEIPPPAVAAIARSATGSFRDALGTLEQLVTYSGSQISLDDVLAVLGVADGRLLAEAVDAVAGGDARAALGVLERCAAQGRDAASFAGDLEARLRELLIVQTLGEVPAELALTPEADAALAEQAAAVPHAVVVRLLELLGEAMEAIRAGAEPRTRLELALVKAAKPEADSSLRALLARIERLEQGGAVVSAVAAQREVPVPVPVPVPAPGGSGSSDGVPEAPVVAPEAPVAPPSAPEVARAGEASAAASQPVAAPAPEAVATPAAERFDGGEPSASASASGSPSPEAAPREAQAGDPPAPEAGAGEQVAGAATVTAAHDLDSICALWPAVIDLVRSENARLGAAILETRPVELSGDELTLAFGSAFLKKQAEAPADRMMVGEALTALSGSRWRLSYELREPPPVDPEADSEEFSEERTLARFMQEFDAEDITAEVDGAVPTATSNEKGA